MKQKGGMEASSSYAVPTDKPQRPWPMRRPCRRKSGSQAAGAPGATAPPATAAPKLRSWYSVLLIRRPRPQSPQLPIPADQAASLPSDAADQFSGRLSRIGTLGIAREFAGTGRRAWESS